ncbi:MAG: histone deacetylase family protein [Herminiimonas sp.]|nr:histone deacetylase family protein [Herminiimonas sp.]
MTTAFYTHPDCLLHEMGAGHPESPARLQAIEDQLIASRIERFLEYHDGVPATDAMITAVHDAGSLDFVTRNLPAIESGPGVYFAIDDDTSLNAFSLQAALRAAGLAVAATDAVIAGHVENAFCAIRPPGHHARQSTPMGFCLFNNVAIAARHAMAAHGLERIAIVDFDVHHGNGTEEAFRDDPRVLMVSFFQYPFYPCTEGAVLPPARPNMLNQPLPAYTAGDVVRQLVTDVWLPALEAHRPQMIFISAGFDAHREDDMGQMCLVEADYAWITQQVMRVAAIHAQGRIVSCLEGGYDLSSLGRSVVAHVKALAQLD